MKMKWLSFLLIISFAISAFAYLFEIPGHYRCKNGSTGMVIGRGDSLEHAKIDARDRARALCNGQVDYIHFRENINIRP